MLKRKRKLYCQSVDIINWNLDESNQEEKTVFYYPDSRDMHFIGQCFRQYHASYG